MEVAEGRADPGDRGPTPLHVRGIQKRRRPECTPCKEASKTKSWILPWSSGESPNPLTVDSENRTTRSCRYGCVERIIGASIQKQAQIHGTSHADCKWEFCQQKGVQLDGWLCHKIMSFLTVWVSFTNKTESRTLVCVLAATNFTQGKVACDSNSTDDLNMAFCPQQFKRIQEPRAPC